MQDIISDHRLSPDDHLPLDAPPSRLDGPGDLVKLIDYAQQYRDENHGDSSQTAALVTVWTKTKQWKIKPSWPNVSVSSFRDHPSVSFIVKVGQDTRQVFEHLKGYNGANGHNELEVAGLTYDESEPIF